VEQSDSFVEKVIESDLIIKCNDKLVATWVEVTAYKGLLAAHTLREVHRHFTCARHIVP
jgi:hypothetical protein